MNSPGRPMRHVTLSHMVEPSQSAAATSDARAARVQLPSDSPEAGVKPMRSRERRAARRRAARQAEKRSGRGRRQQQQPAAPTSPIGRAGCDLECDPRVDEALDDFEQRLRACGPMMSCADRSQWLSYWD